MAATSKNRDSETERGDEIFQAFSAILDEVNRMFSIGSLGRWFAMNRVKARGSRETLGFMERVAGHGFQAVVAPEERDLMRRLMGQVRVPDKDQGTWASLYAKLRRMKMAE